MTTAQEFYIGSKDRNFRINEYLIVEDVQGSLILEIMEANTYNRYMPLDISGDLPDDVVMTSLSQIGYNVDEETIYIAKGRLINEANYPVETGSNVREPQFEEIKNFLINANEENGLLLGSIKNTDKLYSEMDDDLKELYHLYEEDITKQEEVPFLFNIEEMVQYPHIGVFGGSGSGKSYGLRVMIEELMKRGIPTIIFDPHYEMDFQIDENNPSSGRDYNGDFKQFLIGKDMGVDFKELNPSEFKKLLSAISELTEAMESTVDLLWAEYGYSKGPDVNTFEIFIEDLIEIKSRGLSEIESLAGGSEGEAKIRYEHLLYLGNKYDKRVNESTLRGIAWRLRSLKASGVFSYNSSNVLSNIHNGKTSVIQGNSRLLQVYGSYLIGKTYNNRRNYLDHDGEYFPPFVIITDEAHDFAPKGYESPTRSVIREIAQEGRKYGVFLVLATQRPTLLDETVTAQLNSKFIFRTVRGTDIQTIREETDITSEEAKRLPYLRTGDMFASVASIGRTIFSRVRLAETKKPDVKNPFDELKNIRRQSQEEVLSIVEKYLPIKTSDLFHIVGEVEKSGYKYSIDEFEELLNNLVRSEILFVEEEPIFGIKEYRKKE